MTAKTIKEIERSMWDGTYVSPIDALVADLEAIITGGPNIHRNDCPSAYDLGYYRAMLDLRVILDKHKTP